MHGKKVESAHGFHHRKYIHDSSVLYYHSSVCVRSNIYGVRLKNSGAPQLLNIALHFNTMLKIHKLGSQHSVYDGKPTSSFFCKRLAHRVHAKLIATAR
jgi:hypothetical protein